jgi:hypothetical protein
MNRGIGGPSKSKIAFWLGTAMLKNIQLDLVITSNQEGSIIKPVTTFGITIGK